MARAYRVDMMIFGGGSTGGDRRDGGAAPLLFAVDDDEATLELICAIAADAGWEAHGFRCLAELSVALDQRRPRLLILDDDLPDGRGGDIALQLRRDPRMADVTLLVCTAAHPMRQAEIGGWAPVIGKPFEIAEIERFLNDDARGLSGESEYERAG